MMSRRRSITRPSRPRQGELSFLRRRRRLERAFKVAIFAATSLALVAMISGTRAGRRMAVEASRSVRDAVAGGLGIGLDRAEVEARKRRERLSGIEQARENLGLVEREARPALREFLRVARLDRDSALIRWGNFDWSLALSSAVFEADDSGRSYRLRPRTRSVWLVNLSLRGVSAMFEIPDTPEARRLGERAGGRVVPESVQSTNSWGCRGPEPDPSAVVRGIVLGDSNMQGVLVGDDQTPPSRLEARLKDEHGATVSILNTGHLGYSPEQYYYSLVAYHDRFRPHFVVIGLCANDFGDMTIERNWGESGYWLEQITQFCRTRGVAFLYLPLPVEETLIGSRFTTVYPSRIPALGRAGGLNYIDPIEEFATAHLELKAAARQAGTPFPYSPLFNRRYNDRHLSPIGCDLWAGIVARRLRLIWSATPEGWPPGVHDARDHHSKGTAPHS